MNETNRKLFTLFKNRASLQKASLIASSYLIYIRAKKISAEKVERLTTNVSSKLQAFRGALGSDKESVDRIISEYKNSLEGSNVWRALIDVGFQEDILSNQNSIQDIEREAIELRTQTGEDQRVERQDGLSNLKSRKKSLTQNTYNTKVEQTKNRRAQVRDQESTATDTMGHLTKVTSFQKFVASILSRFGVDRKIGSVIDSFEEQVVEPANERTLLLEEQLGEAVNNMGQDRGNLGISIGRKTAKLFSYIRNSFNREDMGNAFNNLVEVGRKNLDEQSNSNIRFETYVRQVLGLDENRNPATLDRDIKAERG